MRYIIDTSSLLAFVKYIQPFEKDGCYTNLLQTKIQSGEIILIDSVVSETKFVAKGIVHEALPFLKDKKLQQNTNDLLPSQKFFNMLDNQFCNKIQRDKLEDFEYETIQKQFLNSADAKIYLLILQNKKTIGIDEYVVINEESNSDNDGKVFKKIPAICDILETKHCNITTFLKEKC